MNLLFRAYKIFRKEGLNSLIRRFSYIFRRYLRCILVPFILHKSKSLADIHSAVDFAFFSKYLFPSIEPNQLKYEITKLLVLLMELEPKVVLEIGTARGGTLFLFTRVAGPEATIISIDLPRGPFGEVILGGEYLSTNPSL